MEAKSHRIQSSASTKKLSRRSKIDFRSLPSVGRLEIIKCWETGNNPNRLELHSLGCKYSFFPHFLVWLSPSPRGRASLSSGKMPSIPWGHSEPSRTGKESSARICSKSLEGLCSRKGVQVFNPHTHTLLAVGGAPAQLQAKNRKFPLVPSPPYSKDVLKKHY